MSVDPREAERFGFFDLPDPDQVSSNPIVTPKPSSSVEATDEQSIMGVTSYVSPTSIPKATVSLPKVGQQPAASGTTPSWPPVDQVSAGLKAESQLASQHANSVKETTDSGMYSPTATAEGVPDTSENDSSLELEPMSEVTPVNVHARRRMGIYGALGALALAVISGNISLPVPSAISAVGPQAGTPQAPDAAASQVATSKLQAAIGTAQAHRQATGSYRGLSTEVGFTAVTGNDMVVIAAVIEGGCWYSAIVPGYDATPRWDATASRCNPDRLTQLQAEIDATE